MGKGERQDHPRHPGVDRRGVRSWRRRARIPRRVPGSVQCSQTWGDVAAPTKVFCAYEPGDREKVEAFAMRLREEKGIDAWFDKWEIAPGDDKVAKLNEGLRDCNCGLIFFSRTTETDTWATSFINSLIHQMLQDGNRVIPLMIEDGVKLPPLLYARARRGIEEIDTIADTILGRSSGAGRDRAAAHRGRRAPRRAPGPAQPAQRVAARSRSREARRRATASLRGRKAQRVPHENAAGRAYGHGSSAHPTCRGGLRCPSGASRLRADEARSCTWARESRRGE
jgi:hypothetical protein